MIGWLVAGGLLSVLTTILSALVAYRRGKTIGKADSDLRAWAETQREIQALNQQETREERASRVDAEQRHKAIELEDAATMDLETQRARNDRVQAYVDEVRKRGKE